jgi:hypothetical protein
VRGLELTGDPNERAGHAPSCGVGDEFRQVAIIVPLAHNGLSPPHQISALPKFAGKLSADARPDRPGVAALTPFQAQTGMNRTDTHKGAKFTNAGMA